MQSTDIPYKFATPWAQDATTGYINVIPPTASGPAASQQLGFPPLTATPVAAGGTPPSIGDFNGFGNYVTLWEQWQQAGAPVGYDAAFSAAIGGYPKGAIITSATAGGQWISTAENNVTDPDTSGAGWAPYAAGKLLSPPIFVTSSTGSLTGMPALTRIARMILIGGGGVGGGANVTASNTLGVGSGGNSGSYQEVWTTESPEGAVITVGAGSSTPNTGGGATTVVMPASGPTYSAPGGQPGTTSTSAIPPIAQMPLPNSPPTGGGVGTLGAIGGVGFAMADVNGGGGGGDGGAIPGLGVPGEGFRAATGAGGSGGGGAAGGYGAGGGGAYNRFGQGTPQVGGAGSNGVVIIYPYS